MKYSIVLNKKIPFHRYSQIMGSDPFTTIMKTPYRGYCEPKEIRYPT
jgi:hypothetical protein